MKGSGKIILGIGAVTSLFLFYVHLNIALFQVSYTMHDQISLLTAKNEEYRHLRFEVNQLKSPQRLAEQMKKHTLELDLPREVFLVEIPETTVLSETPFQSSSVQPITQDLFHSLGRWVRVAQAKPEQ